MTKIYSYDTINVNSFGGFVSFQSLRWHVWILSLSGCMTLLITCTRLTMAGWQVLATQNVRFECSFL